MTITMLCPNHEDEERIISQSIGVCSQCVREGTIELAQQTHRSLRIRDKLVPIVPTDGNVVCSECGNHCRMYEGELGFCNIRGAKGEEVVDKFSDGAVVSWYFDPLPTNCVADWVCPVTTEREIGIGRQRLKNLAVFYGSCNSDCLFCQNASYRTMMAKGSPVMTAQELADAADDYTACVCYFGGDPSPNSEHSVKTSQLLNETKQVRVCYETNGNISKKWLDKITDIIEATGGTFKFDLKAVTPSIYEALTGVSNSVVLRNFKELADSKRERESEFLVASILLVPGYIDIPEVQKLCSFIAECDSSIPTALLGFSPHHAMSDLPRTSMAHARAALETANDQGLSNVRIGNLGLLGYSKYRFV
ncbi:MAG: radical SAM protein [Candidatus Thorarchaeota archaeon]|jgi:pyruvate formate lyase activating enzyme